MVATVGTISAGTGYEYLTEAVATGTHDYYGRWRGPGLGPAADQRQSNHSLFLSS